MTSIINIKEVRAKIAYHEAQINTLKQLLEVGELLEGKQAKAGRSAAKGKSAGAGRKRKGKRGAVTASILALLENSSRPLSPGEIKKSLEEQGVVKKGAATVYSMLLQMTRRGVIKKVSGPDGAGYATGAGGKKKK